MVDNPTRFEEARLIGWELVDGLQQGVDEATANITVTHQGSFWFVKADGETLGHAYKLGGFEGESGWKSLFRFIFRPLWRASAASGGDLVHLEEIHGRVFRDRSEAVGAILAFHGIGNPKYPSP